MLLLIFAYGIKSSRKYANLFVIQSSDKKLHDCQFLENRISYFSANYILKNLTLKILNFHFYSMDSHDTF